MTNDKKKKGGAHVRRDESPRRADPDSLLYHRSGTEETAEQPVLSRRELREKREAEEKALKREEAQRKAEEKAARRRKPEPEPEAEEEYEPLAGISSAKLVNESREEKRERRRKAKKAERKHNSGKFPITLVIVLLVLVLIAASACYLGYKITNSPQNLPNIYVNGIFVGGMTEQETVAELQKFHWDEDAADSLKVTLLSDVSFEVDMCRSGMMLTKEAAAAEAYRYGHSGNIIDNLLVCAMNYINSMDVIKGTTIIDSEYIRSLITEALQKQDELNPPVERTVDQESQLMTIVKGAGEIKMDADALYNAVVTALQSGEKELSYTTLAAEPKMPDFDAIYKELAIEPVDAYYDFDSKTIVPEIDGFTFDIAEAQRLWSSAAVTETVTVPVETVIPEVTKAKLDETLFHDVLGSMETTYGTWDTNRCNNLHLAIGKIDGIILNPGEEFSYNDVVGQRTEEAGFLPAGAYDDGQVVQELGGGVCQISSTLYSACIYSQMTILERTNHYFKVDYLDYGMDATVSWPSPNFRFRNDRDYPVMIHATYDDEYDKGQNAGMVRVEILGTDVDGSYVKVWNEMWTFFHPEFPDIAIGRSILQHRDVYSKDGELLRSDDYGYLDQYYFHEEVYADKVKAHREAASGGGGDGETEIDFG